MFIYIYKLIKKGAVNDDMVYIGSTNDVKHRKVQHKYACNKKANKEYNKKLYKYIRENGGIDEWEMVILDEFNVFSITSKKIVNYENRFINAFDALNKLNSRPENGCTYEEKNITGKLWREKNKDKKIEKDKIYYDDNKEKLNKKMKIYYDDNKDEINKINRKYYHTNKEKLNEDRKIKVNCERCYALIRKDGIKEHQQTQKCINFKNLTI